MSPSLDIFDELDQLDESDIYHQFNVKNAPRTRRKSKRPPQPNRTPKVSQTQARANLAAEEDRNSLEFTYNASKKEAEWLNDSLRTFYGQQWFDDVLQIIKGGKEASVYQLKGNDTTQTQYLAAKVYRPRMFRNLRNDHMYRQGRDKLDADGLTIVNDGMLKAIRQRTGYGRRLMHTSWIEHEVRTMQALAEAGCDVPAFYASGDNAILMEYIGGPNAAAPTLNTVDLHPDEAHALFRRVMRNVERMLACERIHGDLSAYNILYREGKITLIDFPQAINPDKNRNAFAIFERDVTRVCDYFGRQGVRADAHRLATGMWRAGGLRRRPEINPANLDPEDDADVAYWEKMTAD